MPTESASGAVVYGCGRVGAAADPGKEWGVFYSIRKPNQVYYALTVALIKSIMPQAPLCMVAEELVRLLTQEKNGGVFYSIRKPNQVYYALTDALIKLIMPQAPLCMVAEELVRLLTLSRE